MQLLRASSTSQASRPRTVQLPQLRPDSRERMFGASRWRLRGLSRPLASRAVDLETWLRPWLTAVRR